MDADWSPADHRDVRQLIEWDRVHHECKESNTNHIRQMPSLISRCVECQTDNMDMHIYLSYPIICLDILGASGLAVPYTLANFGWLRRMGLLQYCHNIDTRVRGLYPRPWMGTMCECHRSIVRTVDIRIFSQRRRLNEIWNWSKFRNREATSLVCG